MSGDGCANWLDCGPHFTMDAYIKTSHCSSQIYSFCQVYFNKFNKETHTK